MFSIANKIQFFPLSKTPSNGIAATVWLLSCFFYHILANFLLFSQIVFFYDRIIPDSEPLLLFCLSMECFCFRVWSKLLLRYVLKYHLKRVLITTHPGSCTSHPPQHLFVWANPLFSCMFPEIMLLHFCMFIIYLPSLHCNFHVSRIFILLIAINTLIRIAYSRFSMNICISTLIKE